MLIRFRLLRQYLPFIGLLGLVASCKKVCGENLPQYSLSPDERAWAAPFAVNAVWRFRNAAGYERTYRITKQETQNIGYGASKLSVCPSYYHEYIFADIVRTDSTDHRGELYRFQLSAVVPGTSPSSFLQWGSVSAPNLPIAEVEAGQLTLPSATLGGHTYPSVIKATSTYYAPMIMSIYVTKAEGLVAFDDRYGVQWTRL